jgi:hypothetical protein
MPPLVADIDPTHTSSNHSMSKNIFQGEQRHQIDQGYRRKSTNLSFSKDSRSFLSKASKRGSSLQTLLKLSYVVACEISCMDTKYPYLRIETIML